MCGLQLLEIHCNLFKRKTALWRVFLLLTRLIMGYFFFPRAAFFASNSFFASKRFGDLYGRFLVFLFGLNAIIRDIAISIYQFGSVV